MNVTSKKLLFKYRKINLLVLEIDFAILEKKLILGNEVLILKIDFLI